MSLPPEQSPYAQPSSGASTERASELSEPSARPSWRNFFSPGEWIAFAAIAVAVGSLLVSLNSLREVRKQAELAEARYNAAAKLIWIGSIDSDLNLDISPSSSDLRVEYAYLALPSALRGSEGKTLYPPLLRFSLKGVYEKLWSYHSTTMHELPDGGFTMDNGPMSIPIVISSRFFKDGQVHSEEGVYVIPFGSLFTVGGIEEPRVQLNDLFLKGMHFVRHVQDREDPNALVNRMWNEAVEKGAAVVKSTVKSSTDDKKDNSK